MFLTNYNGIDGGFRYLFELIWNFPELRSAIISAIIGFIFYWFLTSRGFSEKIAGSIWGIIVLASTIITALIN
ncbi:MAG: hypothetical protein K0S76_1888 [Herbinix sp.]|jgi:hypothetical protein|nr:hypothetical protein [Herbinix sp.]